MICTVRKANEDYRLMLEDHAIQLESLGHTVHVPHVHTNQDQKGIDICRQNMEAIENADLVLVYYNGQSTGTHFDMGVAFANRKPVFPMGNVVEGEGKSFPRMLSEWNETIPMLTDALHYEVLDMYDVLVTMHEDSELLAEQ